MCQLRKVYLCALSSTRSPSIFASNIDNEYLRLGGRVYWTHTDAHTYTYKCAWMSFKTQSDKYTQFSASWFVRLHLKHIKKRSQHNRSIKFWNGFLYLELSISALTFSRFKCLYVKSVYLFMRVFVRLTRFYRCI